MALLQMILGLVGLAIGGDMLVRGAVGVAERLQISRLVTGLIIVGFGTSTPELAASLSAAFSGSPGIAVGNVVGSNIANSLLILGVASLICPIVADPQSFKRDAPILALATTIFCGFAFYGAMGRLLGAFLVTVLTVYVIRTYLEERRSSDPQTETHVHTGDLLAEDRGGLLLNLALAAAGTTMIVFGALWTIDGAVVLGRSLGVSETIIGLTVVAIGTSLPELATSVIAAIRKEVDVAFGNILGSNIFNILGILGLTALFAPIDVPPGVINYDLWVLAVVTVLLLIFAFSSASIYRREGVIFLGFYGAYMGFLWMRATGIVA